MKKIVVGIVTLLSISGYLCSTAIASNAKSFEGRKLYTTYCFICHGLSGKGDGPLSTKLKIQPVDLTSLKLGKKTHEELECIVNGSCKHKRVDVDISKWNKYLPEPKTKALVSYIQYLSTTTNPLIGDPEAGSHIYEQYCSPCHGKKGKGDGIMVEAFPIKPADHTNAEKMDKRTNEELINTITNGLGKESVMPGWSGILTEKEIKDLVGYVRLLSH